MKSGIFENSHFAAAMTLEDVSTIQWLNKSPLSIKIISLTDKYTTVTVHNPSDIRKTTINQRHTEVAPMSVNFVLCLLELLQEKRANSNALRNIDENGMLQARLLKKYKNYIYGEV